MSPDGVVTASLRLRAGEKALMESPVKWTGKCILEINSGSNLAKIQMGDIIPFAYRSSPENPLQTVAVWGPLYFHVPARTKSFDIWIQSDATREGAHAIVRDPAGRIVREEDGDFDARTRIHVDTGQGQDGSEWSVEITKPKGKGLVLDDVSLELGINLPPFLSPNGSSFLPPAGKREGNRYQHNS